MNYQPQCLKKWIEAPNYLGMDLTDYYVVAAESEQSDTIDMSNYRVWHRLFPDLEQFTFGGFMKFKALMIHKDSLLLEAIDEKMKSLKGYPILDDQDWSELESDQWYEYWSNWGYIECFKELLLTIPQNSQYIPNLTNTHTTDQILSQTSPVHLVSGSPPNFSFSLLLLLIAKNLYVSLKL